MLTMLKRFGQDESGATMVEYGLLVVLIALVAAAGAQIMGNGLNGLFSKIGSTLTGITVPNP